VADSTPPKTDTTRIDSIVGYHLRRAAARQRERFRSIFGPYDIRPVQLTALALIFDNPGVRQTALGKALDMKRANVVTLLDQLQSRGLIERRQAAEDRRSYEVTLTPAGLELTGKLLAMHDKLEQDLADSIGQEQLTTLVELLSRLRRVTGKPKID